MSWRMLQNLPLIRETATSSYCKRDVMPLLQRVHVLLHDRLWPERAFYVSTSAPMNMICVYLDSLT